MGGRMQHPSPASPQAHIMKDTTCYLAFKKNKNKLHICKYTVSLKRRASHYACSCFLLHAYPPVKCGEKFHAGQEESFLIGNGRGIAINFLYAGIWVDY